VARAVQCKAHCTARPRPWEQRRNKSLFASFSSEKEDSSFLKERSKELLIF
jgi:hypothetical protein